MVGQLFARLADGQLGKELESQLRRLFDERSARVVPNDASEYATPRASGHAVATVATPDLDLRFARAPGGFAVDIAPHGERTAWTPLDVPLDRQVEDSNFDWTAVDRYLAENWARIKSSAEK